MEIIVARKHIQIAEPGRSAAWAIAGLRGAPACSSVRMGVMSGDPRECREQARVWARLAMSSSDPRDGADYAALAYTWLKLAEIFEHDNAMLARWDKDSKVVPLSRRRRMQNFKAS